VVIVEKDSQDETKKQKFLLRGKVNKIRCDGLGM
jgi:hypothetical protein